MNLLKSGFKAGPHGVRFVEKNIYIYVYTFLTGILEPARLPARSGGDITRRTGQKPPSAHRDDRTSQPLAGQSLRFNKDAVFSPVIPQLQQPAPILLRVPYSLRKVHDDCASAPSRKMPRFDHRSLESQQS